METILKQFDFTKPQVRVWKVLLSTGGLTVSELARKTGIKRTSCQEYLRVLVEKGFVNMGRLGKKYYYQAEDPDRFRQIVNERIFVVDMLVNELNSKERGFEEWKVSSLDKENGQDCARHLKNQQAKLYGSKDLGVSIGENKVLFTSGDEENPYVSIDSGSIARFLQVILQ